MIDFILGESTPIAQKDYLCNASLFIDEGGKPDYFDCISDYRDYIKAKNNRFKVKKGDRYLRQVFISDGDFCNVANIPEIHRLCIKYELYEM